MKWIPRNGNNPRPSRLSPASGILKTSDDLQAYFMQRVQEILKKYGKTMIGWDEVFASGSGSRCGDPVLARPGRAG